MRLATCDPQFQALKPIRYTLRFPAPHTHYVEVEASIPTAGRPDVEVYMATWTPGSYLIREYERHVEAVTAANGAAPLAVEKSRKNRWKITTGGARTVTLRYKVYSREMTVRNNWVEAGFAMINGAPTFITVTDRAARPHEVKVEPPAAWKGAVIAFLLDAKIRKGSSSQRTLDTGMQWALQRYSGAKGYTPDQFYQVMSEAAGSDLKGWFAKAAESTDELDYTEARAFIGGGTRNDAGHRGRPQRGR